MYYSTQKVLEIIKNYHHHIQLMNDKYMPHESVGVGQYGVDAAMPKANGITNVVEREVFRQLENSKIFADIETDLKYLQQRWHRIEDEQDAFILNMRLNGLSASSIAYEMRCTRDSVHKRLRVIADTIRSYPQ